MAEQHSNPRGAFVHPIAVLAEHIDALGHVGNVTWVRFINDAAIAHSDSIGLDFGAYRALGLMWVVRRHEIDYIGAALVGDRLEASTWIGSLRGATSVRHTRFERGGELLVRAQTTWVLLSAAGRPTRVPAELAARYGFAPGGARSA
ncbi:MAG: acyl-CoA thioesterase [Polyangiaceae bacterium]|nr:acyl-CoA thioesterase [Polyangiaceae bacterium]